MANLRSPKAIGRLQRQANFVRDKDFFLRALQKFLIIIGVGFLLAIAIGIFTLFYQYYFDGKQAAIHNELLLSVNNPKYQEQVLSLQPDSLRVSSNKVLENFKKNYDFISSVTNPNENWYAVIDYYFQGGSYKGDLQTSFILPKQNRSFWDLNVINPQKITNGKIVIENIDWVRASRYDELRTEYWHFLLDDIELVRAKDLAGDDEDISRLEFVITNDSIYNFWNLGLAINLKRYDELVAFYYYELEDFLSDEKRSIDLTFFEDLPGITDIDIVPLLNVFDEDNIYFD